MAIAYRSVLASGGMKIDSISVTTPPTKTSYFVGDTIDTTGMVVTATAGLLSGNVASECTVSPQTFNTAGTQAVTVSYGGKTDTFNVTVIAEAISITTQPTKRAYIVGDTLDLTGIVVTSNKSGNVTSSCTFSPANGSTLSTAGTITVTATYNGLTTTTTVTATAISGISITTPPTKTSYNVNEYLDLTGIVVTATAGSLTRDVTASCTFSPANGTQLTTGGTFNITATYGSFTATTSYTVNASHTYGVQWDGSSAHAWTRTDDAANFSDPQPYYSGMSGTPSSPFDSRLPWSGMEIVDDADLGKLVKIPKFWFKWTRSGSSMKLQISDAEQTGFHVSPAHADRGDGAGERDYVYVGRYHCAASTYKSTSGVTPAGNMTRAEFRTAIHNLHTKAWQYDFAMWWTINMLYLVEFADWNSQAKIGGGCSEGTGTSSAVYNMGTTDNMPYHTGTVASSIGATAYGANQYRYIENLWGNVFDWIDGIYFSDRTIYAIKNPANFSDDTGGTNVGTRANANGVVTEWTAPSASGFEYALYPAAVTTDNNYETYSCDNSVYGASGVVLCGGGYYNQNQSNGAFYLYGSQAASYKNANRGSRLQKLP